MRKFHTDTVLDRGRLGGEGTDFRIGGWGIQTGVGDVRGVDLGDGGLSDLCFVRRAE